VFILLIKIKNDEDHELLTPKSCFKEDAFKTFSGSSDHRAVGFEEINVGIYIGS